MTLIPMAAAVKGLPIFSKHSLISPFRTFEAAFVKSRLTLYAQMVDDFHRHVHLFPVIFG